MNGMCDFCMERPVFTTVNDDLWWICEQCYAKEFRGEEE